jgi:hypothetical protein
MATKIVTALVAALVVGALMTPNHEAFARGGGGFGEVMEVVSAAKVLEAVSPARPSTEVVSTVVDSGSRGDSDAPSDMDAVSDFGAAIPILTPGMGMAAVRITTAPTDAIERHGTTAAGRGGARSHLPPIGWTLQLITALTRIIDEDKASLDFRS